MKIGFSVMLFTMLMLSTEASSVLWNIVSKGDSGYQEFQIVRNDERPYFWSIFNFDVTVSGNSAILTSNPGGNRILSYAGAWLIATVGDIVNAETTLHAGYYFEYGLVGYGETLERPLVVDIGVVNYMKIVLQDGEQCFDYQDNTRAATPDCYYGWMAFSVNGYGTVDVLSSALDVTGAAIIVGSGVIPEPSSALLLLLGCAGLLLKRGHAPGAGRNSNA